MSNRKSWLFSSRERFRAKWVPVRVKKTRRELKPFAGVGVTDRRREEAEAEGQHEDVQHEMLLVTLVSTPKRCVLTRKAKCDRSTRERDWDRDLVRISRREVPLAVDALLLEASAGGSDGEWAAETRAGLMTKSPTSLKVTLRQLTLGQGYDIEAALALEYRLTQHFMQGHDFYEGVRAALIDKDQRPHWQPATLAEVTEAVVDGYFVPLGDSELRFD